MNRQILFFLLMPDKNAARRMRRILAEQGRGFGVRVGVWRELLEETRRAFLLPIHSDQAWQERFADALAQVTGFWTASLRVAPEETQKAVEDGLRRVLTALPPDQSRQRLLDAGLPHRGQGHLRDLLTLVAALDGALPADLMILREALAPGNVPLRLIRVTHLRDWPRLDAWQQDLIDSLNRDVPVREEDREWARLLMICHKLPGAAATSSLRDLQDRLFEADGVVTSRDASVQWVGVRDLREEVEVAAGMVQERMRRDASLSPGDFGLLLPADPDYLNQVAAVFGETGLPLAGLTRHPMTRDLGRETILHFLYCRQKPAPAMALAALFTSPLLPWDEAIGLSLAQAVMNGDYGFRLPEDATREAVEVLRLVRETQDTPDVLIRDLKAFLGLLRREGSLERHHARAMAAVAAVVAGIASSGTVHWPTLRSLVLPHPLEDEVETAHSREGIAVTLEHEEPWRGCRHLLVLGFNAGRYPAGAKVSPLWSTVDQATLAALPGVAMDTPEAALRHGRRLFQRQLAAAEEGCTFLISRRTAMGEPLSPSESLVFMQRLLAPDADPEGLVLELDRQEDRLGVTALALADDAPPMPPRALLANDLTLTGNLLEIGSREKGKPRAQSPSSLEGLMVSPLAWLLKRLGAEPQHWVPEAPHVTVRGSLAHQVFEWLFPAGHEVPGEQEVGERVPSLFAEAINREAPFLRAAHYTVERGNLEREIREAALAWRGVLQALDARVLASEIWLEGWLDRQPIHGQADTILKLPNGRLLVVDFKKSSSRSRRERMRMGFDSQVELYRIMLETGGPVGAGQEALRQEIAQAPAADVLYFMMNDRTVLTDAPRREAWGIPNWTVLENNVSAEALALIRNRIGEVSRGLVRLNRPGDEEFFNKSGKVTPYALDVSPLIRLFMPAGQSGEG